MHRHMPRRVTTPWGELDGRRLDRMSMEEIWDEVRLSRRGLLAGAVTSPLLWVPTASSSAPARAVHSALGADPQTQVSLSFATPASVAKPVLDLGTTTAYGTTVAMDSRAAVGTRTVYHHARLSGLKPGTTYHWRARFRGGRTQALTFTTAPATPKAFRFTCFGDQAVNGFAADTAAIVARAKPAFHLHPGDICYANESGAGGDHQVYDASVWDTWFAQNAAAQRRVPWMAATGNHEMEPGQGPQGYNGVYARFSLPRNGISPNTYSFRYGNVAVVTLDGNDASYEIGHNRGWLGARQDRWLDTRLRTLRADPQVDFLVVQFHNCAWSTCSAHASDGGVRDRWGAIFDRHQVDLVLNGHNHCYERTHPIRNGQMTGTAAKGATVRAAEHGTIYVTAGAGGASTYRTFLHPGGRVLVKGGAEVPEQSPWSAVRATDHSVVVVDVTPPAGGTTRMHLRTVSVTGATLDELTLERAVAPVAAAPAVVVGSSPSPAAAAVQPTAHLDQPDHDGWVLGAGGLVVASGVATAVGMAKHRR